MKLKLLLIVFILVSKPLYSLEPVILDNTIGEYPLGLHLEILEDKGKKWTIKDITSDKLSKQFVRSKVKVPNFGFTDSAYWVRFTVKNRLDKEHKWYLEISHPIIDQIDLYIPKKNNQYIKRTAGDYFPYSEREIKHRNVVFSLTEAPNEQKTYYIRFETTSSKTFSLNMYSPKAFLKKAIHEQIALGLFYGIILVMIFYNLFLYLSIRDISYLNYVLFIFGMVALYLGVDGIAFQYLPFDLGFWFNNNIHLIIYFMVVWLFQFTRTFLNITRQDFILYRMLMVLTFLSILGVLLSLFLINRTIYQLAALSTVIAPLIAIIASYLRLKKGYRPARFFLLAWFILTVGGIAFGLKSLGFLPDNIFTRYTLKFGSVIEVILLSLALADRINIMKRDKEEAQAESIQNQQLAIDNLHKADQLKDEFLANTSHELRTPLNGIIGLSESLIQGTTDQISNQANLNMIISSAKRLSSLVSDMLDFSKIKHKELDLQIKSVDLFAITEIVLTLSKPLIGNKPLKLVNLIDPDVPLVLADENRLQQIMYNLIGNGIKFTEKGKVEISTQTNDSELMITVSDTGIGIPADKLNDIFNAFEQVDGSISREFGGTGIGLTITKQLIELHHGEIKVESIPGLGSQFYFTLPLAKENKMTAMIEVVQNTPLEDTKVSKELLVVPDTVSIGNPDEKYHILVVDDDPINLQVLVNQLTRANCTITQTMNGLEALDIVEKEKTDFVLLDIMMPRMSGYQVCLKIRERHSLDELPIILLTAKDHISDIVAGFDVGANDYIIKPFSRDELISRINLHLNLKTFNDKLRQLNQVLEENEVKLITEKSVNDRLEKELTRLSTTIHNSIINKLESIGNFIRHDIDTGTISLNRLDHIERLISHCSKESKNMLFVLKNRSCSLKRLSDELKLKAELSFYLIDIAYQIDNQFSNQELIVKLDVVQYILDVYNELLNNIVKHSLATEVNIVFICRDNQLTLSVQDNGIGFDYSSQIDKTGSYGLGLLDEITQKAKASLSIHSQIDEGTLATVVVEI